MMNTKNTKRALWSSVLALFLCFSMLLGTTYAWFTDSVVSGSNVITSGNLDVEVSYTLDGENWKPLDGANDLFQKNLWEPGHTEVVALKIENKGTLALKYQANLNIIDEVVGTSVNGGDIVLSEILQVSTLVQPADANGDMTVMQAYASENGIAYETPVPFKSSNILRTNQGLTAGEAHYLIVKVDMPETVGNEANHNGEDIPSIEFGINVLATQYTYENDSFGTNYDEDALYPEVAIEYVTKNSNEDTSVKTEAEDVKVDIPGTAEDGNYQLVVTNKTETTDEDGNTTVSMDITLRLNGEELDEAGNVVYTVSVEVGAGKKLGKLIHNGEEITDYSYNINTGVVTFSVTHFSPFYFIFTDSADVCYVGDGLVSYATLEDAIAAVKGTEATITLIKDVKTAGSMTVTNGTTLTLNLNGKTITGTDTTDKSYAVITNCGNLTITGEGTITAVAEINSGWSRFSSVISNQPGGKLTVNGGKIEHLGGTDMAYGIDNLTNGKGTYAEIIVNGGTVKSTYRAIRQFLNGIEADNILTVNGGTIEGVNKSIWMQDPSAYSNTGKLTVSDKATLIGDVYLSVTAGSTEWPVEVAIAASAVKGEVISGNVPAGYSVVKTAAGIWTVKVGNAISNVEELKTLLTKGGTGVLTADLSVDADDTITVPAGVTAELDLNGYTIAGVTDNADKNEDGKFTSADNEVMIDVRGTLTVKNGTMTIQHTADDFGWNACTEVFYVAFNGTLNVENATIENLGGSAMAYVIDLVNADAKTNGITLNVKNSTLKSSYIPVRVFNNGAGMNNVTINDTVLEGTSRAFWVHIYSSKDNGGKGVKDATLNLDIYGNGNTFIASNPERIIEFGFDDEINFNAEGAQYVSTAEELTAALEQGNSVVFTNDIEVNVDTTAPYGNKYGIALNGGVLDGNGKTLKFKSDGSDHYGIMTSGGTIKNVTITGVFRGIVIMSPDEDVIIDNVTINDEDVCYAINTAEHAIVNGVKMIVSNSTFGGWISFAGIESASFTNCTFKQGTYYTDVYGRLVKPYVNTVFENCEFGSTYYIDLSALENDQIITFKGCAVNGVKLTADNWTSYVAPEATCGEGQISVELKNGSYLTASNVVDYIIFK